MKLIKLNNRLDFILLGIVSVENFRILLSIISDLLKESFQQMDEIILRDNELGDELLYQMFVCDSDTDISYTLIENKIKQKVLLKSLKQIDYLLKIEGDFTKNHIDNLIQAIRNRKEITAVILIRNEQLKLKEQALIS